MALERDPNKLFPHDHLMKWVILPLIPKKVTPNSITIVRFIGIPFVLYFLLLEQFHIGVPLFLVLAFTDALDGSLARVRKQITQWGTFYDPVADKLLIGLVALLIIVKYIHPVFAFIIVVLELLIIAGGLRTKNRGKVISANIFGKTKMFLQVAGVTILLIAVWAGIPLFVPISAATLSLAIVFAVVSLFTYGL